MPSSRPPSLEDQGSLFQIGLDFVEENQYISAPLQGEYDVDAELFAKLEEKVSTLFAAYSALKEENQVLKDEISRMQENREGLKDRIDGILSKLEGL